MIPQERTINIDTISLFDFDFIDKSIIVDQDFQYGSIDGIAELIGFQIILFKKAKNKNNVVLSIDWGTNKNPLILEISQNIMKQLNMSIALSDPLKDLEALYGKADYIHDIYENSITYYYINTDQQIMYSFDIDQFIGLIRFELMYDQEIISDRIKVILQK